MTAHKRGTPDFLLLILTFGLIGFGLVMVFSASYNTSLRDYHDPMFFTKKQMLWAALGSAALFFFMNIRYNALKKWVVPYFLVIVILLVLVLFVGKDVNGARSWFVIGPIGGQPTEFAKLGVILYLSYLINKRKEKIKDFKKGLVPLLVIIGIIALLIMMQPDFGSCVILLLISGCMIITGGARIRHLLLLAGVLSLFMLIFVLASAAAGKGYRLDRFTSYLHPWQDPLGSGYHLIQSWFALGHGGLLGAGFGQSIEKLAYLPEAQNDFIFAVIGEELGFVGACVFILVYLLFLWRGILVAVRSKDTFGTLCGTGIVCMFALQAVINIGGVTGTIPITGITIPLISFGGSSLLSSMMALGILLSISRENNRLEKEKTTSSDNPVSTAPA